MNNFFSSPDVKAYTLGKHATTSPLEELPTISLEQTHSSSLIEITDPSELTVLDTDAVLTRKPNLHLRVKHADCLPVLIFHPLPIIGAIHAGRKGTEQSILKKVLTYLKDTHGISSNLQLWFGPAICKECYQVDRKNNFYYDLVAKNTFQVREVYSEQEAHILYSNRCTAHENEHFFSYRKEGKGVSMNWSGIALIPNTIKEL